jgi:mRNA-degrading endonuclease RelE of RelBE toxin-antitoxin system
MKYDVKFPGSSSEKQFEKVLSKIPGKEIRSEIIKTVEDLALNPRPFGEKPFKMLKPPIQFYRFTAQYRIRIGNYRVLFDVDDTRKIVWILALRKRSEKTYK